MEKKRLEVKVGLFVFIGLALLGVLLLQFSKGTSAFRGTYIIKLTAGNAGSLKPSAQVLLAGVQVGVVQDIQLAPDDKSVVILLRVYKENPIYADARFVIQSANFLGDQFIAVIPTDNKGPALTNDQEVACEEPFDLQETARAAGGFVKRLDGTAQKLDSAVNDLRSQVLNAQTLSSFGVALTNMKSFTVQALDAVQNINNIVITNGAQAGLAVSNIVYFSAELTQIGQQAQNILALNGTNIQVATSNIDDITASLKQVAADLQAGKGLAGEVLQNQELATNILNIAANLSVTSSNLNRHGLWGIMWSHKPPANTNTNK